MKERAMEKTAKNYERLVPIKKNKKIKRNIRMVKQEVKRIADKSLHTRRDKQLFRNGADIALSLLTNQG